MESKTATEGGLLYVCTHTKMDYEAIHKFPHSATEDGGITVLAAGDGTGWALAGLRAELFPKGLCYGGFQASRNYVWLGFPL